MHSQTPVTHFQALQLQSATGAKGMQSMWIACNIRIIYIYISSSHNSYAHCNKQHDYNGPLTRFLSLVHYICGATKTNTTQRSGSCNLKQCANGASSGWWRFSMCVFLSKCCLNGKLSRHGTTYIPQIRLVLYTIKTSAYIAYSVAWDTNTYGYGLCLKAKASIPALWKTVIIETKDAFGILYMARSYKLSKFKLTSYCNRIKPICVMHFHCGFGVSIYGRKCRSVSVW